MVFSSFFCQILVVLTWGWLYGTAVCLSYWVHVKALPLNEEDITRYCFLQTNSILLCGKMYIQVSPKHRCLRDSLK